MTTKKTYTAGGVVLNKDGKVLVVNQNNNSWSLPKGHIDPGEDAFTAAKREIYEESGIEEKHLTFVKDLGSYERYRISLNGDDDKSELKVIQIFLFKSDKEDLKPIDPMNPVAIWVEKENVEALLTHKKDIEFFKTFCDAEKIQYWDKVCNVYKFYPTVRHRFNFVYKSLGEYVNKSKFSFFDYGCGDGTLLETIKSKFDLAISDVGGCDSSDVACTITREKNVSNDIYNSSYPEIKHKYDVISCIEVIEHSEQYKDILSWIYKNLNNDGLLILSTQTGKIHASDRYTKHTQHFNKKELETVLENIGFTIIHSSLWGFPFFSLQKKMTDYNFSFVKDQFLEGEISLFRKIFFKFTYYLYLVHNYINSGPQIFLVLRKA
jgi:2-polyprenyl-3-methyl-5-hydroxy-6-metoxy-1,4-benzoquinol methylase